MTPSGGERGSRLRGLMDKGKDEDELQQKKSRGEEMIPKKKGRARAPGPAKGILKEGRWKRPQEASKKAIWWGRGSPFKEGTGAATYIEGTRTYYKGKVDDHFWGTMALEAYGEREKTRRHPLSQQRRRDLAALRSRGRRQGFVRGNNRRRVAHQTRDHINVLRVGGKKRNEGPGGLGVGKVHEESPMGGGFNLCKGIWGEMKTRRSRANHEFLRGYERSGKDIQLVGVK